MAEPYFDKPDRERLKEGLYAYLKDKAKRRSAVTGTDAYNKMQDQFAEQDGRYATGALLGGLSEAASMAGTIGGKRAESNIIPKMNDDLYKSRQGHFENLKSLRNMEENSNMNDLQTARYLTNLDQYDDQNKRADETHASNMETGGLNRDMLRKKLREKYDLDPRIEAPGGAPVQFDEVGNPRTLPGYKINKGIAKTGGTTNTHWSVLPNVSGPNGEYVERNPVTSEQRVISLPKGFNKSLSAADTSKVGDGRDAANKLVDLEKIINQNVDIIGPVMGRVGKMNPYDERAQNLDSELRTARQMIGKYMEGGVLRKEDEIKYENMLPKLSDTPEVAKYKLKQVSKMISDKQRLDLEALQGQGYKTPGLQGRSSLDEKRKRLDELRAKKAGGQ